MEFDLSKQKETLEILYALGEYIEYPDDFDHSKSINEYLQSKEISILIEGPKIIINSPRIKDRDIKIDNLTRALALVLFIYGYKS